MWMLIECIWLFAEAAWLLGTSGGEHQPEEELWWTPHFENYIRSRLVRCCTEAGSYKTLLKEADKEAELVFYMLHAIGIRKQWLIAQLGQT
jgi:hypothetical protein